MDKLWSLGFVCALGVGLPGCSGDDSSKMMMSSSDLGATNPNGTAGDDQTPPTTSGADVEAWLKTGAYKKWDCETVDHPQLKVSPHGQNRVCSNSLAAAFKGAPEDERPIGTASVKELLDDSSKLVGYAVGVKIAAKSAGGANWYWYERVPLSSKAPHNSEGVVADGLGSTGTAQSICVGCHAGAGTNDAHSVMMSSDFVYLQAGAASSAGDAQTPPTTNGADVEAWLEKGDYKKWKCETVDHPQLKVSPHGQNRVCSNDLAAGFTGTTSDERPVGTASVKELLDDASKLVGYAVAVKTASTSAAGANWYWYERVPLDSAAPHDKAGVVADGMGDSGPAKSICVGCHAGAGSNDGHNVMASSDYVYLQVGK